MSEIDSFIWKFRKLLHSGNNAHLEIRSEAGKATVNLTAEVEIPFKPQFQSRNGPARQRRHERRAAERAAAAAEDAGAQTEVAAEDEPEKVSDVGVVLTKTFKDAVEAKKLEAAQLFEPTDEIENETISSDEEPEKLCTSVSIIPIRKVSGSDDVIEKVIKEKLSEKGVTIMETGIHRSDNGTFIRFDARIEPISGKMLEETNFGFLNCRVIPILGI